MRVGGRGRWSVAALLSISMCGQADTAELETVTVTARRRAEDPLSVPIAMSVLDAGRQIGRAHV